MTFKFQTYRSCDKRDTRYPSCFVVLRGHKFITDIITCTCIHLMPLCSIVNLANTDQFRRANVSTVLGENSHANAVINDSSCPSFDQQETWWKIWLGNAPNIAYVVITVKGIYIKIRLY